MKILLDECVPKDLRELLVGHETLTVSECGWSGIKNGELLKLAAAQFEVFLTVDKNLSFQQDPESLPVTVLVLHSQSNKLVHLTPLIPITLELLREPLQPKVFHVKV